MTGEEIIVAFDIAVDKVFLELLHDNKDLVNITKRYKNHE